MAGSFLNFFFMKLFIVLFLFVTQLNASVPDSLNKNRLIGISSFSVATFAVSQAIQYEQFWENRSKFHIMPLENEYKDALLADKYGHFFASYAISKSYAKLLEWTGMSEESRVWVGAGVSLLNQTVVEINDGFSEGEVYLGFSFGDMLFNITGAGFPVLQYYYPILECINFKISFSKSDNFDRIGYDYMINDYESTYHWRSINPFILFGVETKYWDILSIAIGHSVKDIDRNGAGFHEIYLGLDINWKHFYKYDLVINNYYLQFLIELLDKYKFPLPSIRITPSFEFYGFQR
jgi:hypothetical protein